MYFSQKEFISTWNSYSRHDHDILAFFCCPDGHLITLYKNTSPLFPAFSVQLNSFFSVEPFTNWQVWLPHSLRIWEPLGSLALPGGGIFKVLTWWSPTPTPAETLILVINACVREKFLRLWLCQTLHRQASSRRFLPLLHYWTYFLVLLSQKLLAYNFTQCSYALSSPEKAFHFSVW